MSDDKVVSLGSQSLAADPLTALLREKASALLQAAIKADCAELLAPYGQVRGIQGRQAVVRNGYLPERSVVTGLGPIAVKVPRVRDRIGQGDRARRPIRIEAGAALCEAAASVDAVLPWPYGRNYSVLAFKDMRYIVEI